MEEHSTKVKAKGMGLIPRKHTLWQNVKSYGWTEKKSAKGINANDRLNRKSDYFINAHNTT